MHKAKDLRMSVWYSKVEHPKLTLCETIGSSANAHRFGGFLRTLMATNRSVKGG